MTTEDYKYPLLWVKESTVPNVDSVKIYKNRRTIVVKLMSGSSIRFSKGAGQANWGAYLAEAEGLIADCAALTEER